MITLTISSRPNEEKNFPEVEKMLISKNALAKVFLGNEL